MDSSNNQKIKNARHNKPQASNSVGEEKTPSRFSRRRFLQSSAVASPFLMSIKSPVAWGSGYETNKCSLTTYISGNASHPHNCNLEVKSPGYWHRVFKSYNGDTHYVVHQALNHIGIYKALTFNEFFLQLFLSSTPSTYMGWKYQLSASSDNPSFEDALPNGRTNKYNLIFRFEKQALSGVPLQEGEVNLTKNAAPNIHKFIVAGYLNSVFHPTVISYIYYPEQVKQAVNLAVINSAEDIIMQLNNGKGFSYFNSYTSNQLVDLKAHLNKWD